MKIGTTEVTRLSAGGTLAREARLGTQQVYSIFKDPVSALFFRRQTAGGSVTSPALPQYGKALLSTIKGNSMVWNQQCYNGEAERTFNASYSSGSYAANIVNGHSYLIKFISNLTSVPPGGMFRVWYSSRSINFGTLVSGAATYSYIFTAATDASSFTVYIVDPGSLGGAGTIKYAQIVDLTLLFNGAVPAGYTVADFERDYPLNYYGYNPGQIIDLTGQGLETVGFNQWDEEWVNAYLNASGQLVNNANNIASQNYIPVFPSTTYFFKSTNVETIAFYDLNKGHIQNIYPSANTTFQTPAGCYYIRFHSAQSTYHNNICINISNATKNGTYEPYWKSTKNLGLDSFNVLDGQGNTITIHGLAKAGDVYDEIDVARQKYVKRRARVNLGDLTDWFNTCVDGTASVANGRMSSAILASIIKRAANNQVANLTCSIYTRSTANKTYVHYNDKIVACGAEGAIYIYDSAYISSTGAQFKTAMNGVYLDYELATPEEYDLETPMDAEYRIDYLGTEALIPENSSTPSTAKFSAEIKYPK